MCLGTSDPERAARFYDTVLGTLGHRRCEAGADWEAAGWRGWGSYERNGTMVALTAGSWKQVDQFHAAALAHGGTSEGAPGLRPQYTPDFYAAYVRDPDGNKLAAVCRGFTEPQER